MIAGNVPRIETQRLILQRFIPEDLAEWTRLTFADPEVMKYHNPSSLAPGDRAVKTLAWHERNWSSLGFGGLLITRSSDAAILGDCYLGPADEADEIELGYAVARDHWGEGIATEASKALVRYGFETAGLDRIAGFAMPVNVASWRVLEKVGFEYERDDHLFGLDVRCYAIHTAEFRPDDSLYRVSS